MKKHSIGDFECYPNSLGKGEKLLDRDDWQDNQKLDRDYTKNKLRDFDIE